jgi:hypothetical protein
MRPLSAVRRRRIFAVYLIFSCRIALSQMAISEIQYDPSGPEASDEFVELVNVSSDTVNLAGWQLGDGTGSDPLADAGRGLCCSPGQFVLVLDADYFSQSDSYDTLVPVDALVITVEGSTLGSAGLSNTKSKTVMLYDSFGIVVDAVAYTIGNAPGHSDERIDTAAPNTAENWADSLPLSGTPGFRNSVCRAALDLKVREFSWTDTDSQRLVLAAMVENTGSKTVTSYEVMFFINRDSDPSIDPTERIGEPLKGTPLSAGDSRNYCMETRVIPGRSEYGVEVVARGDERPESNRASVCAVFVIPARAVVINEIMIDPLPGGCEWIELFNPGPEEVNIHGCSLSDMDTSKACLVAPMPEFMPPQGFMVLAADSAFLILHPESAGGSAIPRKFPNFNRLGDGVVILDPLRRVVDCVDYESGWAGERGQSLERISPQAQSGQKENWNPSVAACGSTPGRTNSVALAAAESIESIAVTPNPFSPDGDASDESVLIQCRFPGTLVQVRLKIYDLAGRCVRRLEAGNWNGESCYAVWDGIDDLGQPAPVGQYIVCLEATDSHTGRVQVGRKVLVLARQF